MIRDPFYREITRRLGETLDPELFERCAADLLSEEWPSLVPIRGGSDFGMDGAVGDGEGPAFPLVSTTSDDVIGNLTCNLTSYVNHGGARRKVILATSRQLTPKRRYNLESRATEKGFTLVHVYDQAAIANRLYRNPKWCRELLNLSGTPPALSRIPLGGRPLLGDTLIGREADFHWIQNKKEDCLIVGQPGSGKTFLLRKLAETDKALFMVSDNREEIATALRELSPPTVIVDDAHGTLDTLLRLRHLREETGISFQIAASAWPGDEERIAEMLNLTEADVRSLELLTRDEIVQVVKLAGIQGPDELIRHIVNQSEGRPGLATTLVHLCLRGDVAQVAVGDALNRSICTTLEKLVGRRAVQMLAAFAFGGDSGMQPMDVAGALGISPLDIQHDLIGLSSGGVILQLRDNALSVRPRDLRYPLLRDVFFSGPAPLPADTLIELTPDKGQLAICLIGTRRVGGNVSSDLLLSILEESQSPKAWAHFASLGQSEARIALRSHPEMFFDIVPAVLHSAPSLVLPILMERAIGDNRQQSSYPEHPLRILHDWIRSAYPSSPGVLIRRTETLGAAAQWLKKGGEENVGMQALAAAFDPYFELNRTDPGGGHTFTITSGSLPVEQIKSITGLWERAVATLSIGSWKECAPLLDMVERWRHPGSSIPFPVPEETTQVMKAFANHMMADIADLTSTHRGIQHRLNRMMRSVHGTITLQLDPEFAVLFPDVDRANRREEERKQNQALELLASQWANGDPVELCHRLLTYDAEAREAGLSRPWRIPTFSQMLADKVAQPLIWAGEFFADNAPVEIIAPFLLRARDNRDDGYEEVLGVCFDTEAYQRLATFAVLTDPEPPASRIICAHESAALLADDLDILCLRGQIAPEMQLSLLRHSNPAVSVAVAMGIWEASRNSGVIDSQIETDWLEVITRSQIKPYQLMELFREKPNIAKMWLSNRLQADTSDDYKLSEAEGVAIQMLNNSEKLAYIRQLPRNLWGQKMAKALVERDIRRYRFLLSLPDLESLHLAPLELANDPAACEMAIAALEHGYSLDHVFAALTPFSLGIWTWCGHESDMWADWERRFSELLSHPDARLRTIAAKGVGWAQDRRKHATEHERREAVYGLDGL